MSKEQASADRRWFELDTAAYEEFVSHLDRPAVIKPRLAKMMTEEEEE